MIIDISDIVSCENKEVTEQVQIELESFVSRLGEFPIIEKAPIDLQIANIDGGKLREGYRGEIQCKPGPERN